MLGAQTPSNRETSVDWLLHEPPGPARDVVLSVAASVLEDKNKPLVFKALAGMQDERTKTGLLHKYGFNWLTSEPVSARQMVSAEVIQSYDRLTQIVGSGILDVIPGLSPSINFNPNL